jgi:hypothetical protein
MLELYTGRLTFPSQKNTVYSILLDTDRSPFDKQFPASAIHHLVILEYPLNEISCLQITRTAVWYVLVVEFHMISC